MNRAQRFERRLERVVGAAFARVFKGQVEPVEIGAALEREATDQKAVMGADQILAPNRYRVTLGASDYDRLQPWQDQLVVAFAELVQEHLDDNGWATLGDVEVYLARDETLHYAFYRDAVKAHLEINPNLVQLVTDVMLNFEMPGRGMPDYERRVAIIAKHAHYGPAEYYSQVLDELMSQWDIRRLQPTYPEACEALQKAIAHVDRLARIAARGARNTPAPANAEADDRLAHGQNKLRNQKQADGPRPAACF